MSEHRRTARLEEFYQAYLVNQDSATFIKRVTEYYTLATLERLLAGSVREARRAAALALGLVGDYEINAALGRALADEDRTVRTLAENGIRNVWRRIGANAQRQQLAVIIRLNNAQQYGEAISHATRLIEDSPWLAEAWNQRAIAYYCSSRYSDAIADCHQALELNPYHFDAATGMGQCYLQLGDEQGALECLQRALKLNPSLEGVRAGVEYLSRARKPR